MAPEPAVFILDERLQIARRHVGERDRITPDALRVGKPPQRRPVFRHHHTGRRDVMQRQRPQAIGRQHRQPQQKNKRRQPAPAAFYPRQYAHLRRHGERTAGRSCRPPLRRIHRFHLRLRDLISARRHRPRQIDQRHRLAFIDSDGGDETVIAELDMLNIRLLHLVKQVLHRVAILLQAGAAVGQILVFQLQTGWQQINHQRVRNVTFGGHLQLDQHQFAAAQRGQRFLLAVGIENSAFNPQHVASRLWRALRITAAIEAQPQRLTAGITHLQRRQPIAVEVAGLRFVAGQRLRLQRGFRLPAARQVRQRTSGKEQGVGFWVDSQRWP